MSTETTLAPETAQPEQQPAELAQPQTDAEQKPEAQTEAPDEDKGLSEHDRLIRQQQRRIARLTAGRGAAQREVEILREQLAQLQQKPQGQEDDSTPDPRDVDRLANERAESLVKQRTIQSKVQAVLASGSKLDGFDQAVNAVAEEVPFTDRKGAPTPFVEAVLEADNPAALLHYLGQNPDEAAKFAGLSPAQTGRLLAKLEVQMEREAKAKTSAAPKPLEPVKPAASQEKDLADMSYAEFVKARKAQLKR